MIRCEFITWILITKNVPQKKSVTKQRFHEFESLSLSFAIIYSVAPRKNQLTPELVNFFC